MHKSSKFCISPIFFTLSATLNEIGFLKVILVLFPHPILYLSTSSHNTQMRVYFVAPVHYYIYCTLLYILYITIYTVHYYIYCTLLYILYITIYTVHYYIYCTLLYILYITIYTVHYYIYCTLLYILYITIYTVHYIISL